MGSGLERQPLAARLALVLDPNARPPVGRHGATLAVSIRPAIDRVGNHSGDRSVTGPAPHGLAAGTLGGQIESVFEKPQQRLAGAAQFLHLVEDPGNRLLHPPVRVFLQAIAVLHVTDRRGNDQLAAFGFLVTRGQRALPQQVELVLVQRALQPQQQPVVALARRIDGLLVHQNRIDHPAHLDQLLPIPAVAGEPRHFAGRHRANLAQADLRDHAVESGALGAAGRGTAEILVNGVDLRETQLLEPAAHRILQRTALAVVQNLMNGRLANIQDRLAFQMVALELVRHYRSPGSGAPRWPPPRLRRHRSGNVPETTEPSGPSPAAAFVAADSAIAACSAGGCDPEDRTEPIGWTSGGMGA